MSLIDSMVWILANNDNLHLVDFKMLGPRPDLGFWRKNLAFRSFPSQELTQLK